MLLEEKWRYNFLAILVHFTSSFSCWFQTRRCCAIWTCSCPAMTQSLSKGTRTRRMQHWNLSNAKGKTLLSHSLQCAYIIAALVEPPHHWTFRVWLCIWYILFKTLWRYRDIGIISSLSTCLYLRLTLWMYKTQKYKRWLMKLIMFGDLTQPRRTQLLILECS